MNPPAQSLDREYYVATNVIAPYVYLTATQRDTNLLIDYNNDGTWNVNTTLVPGIEYSTGSISSGGRILASKPIIALHRPSYFDDGGYAGGSTFQDLRNATSTDFYVQYPRGGLFIFATQDNTLLMFDTN